MKEVYVGYVFFKHEFTIEESTELDTYGEAVAFIEGCSDHPNFDYGTVEKRFRKGEAQ